MGGGGGGVRPAQETERQQLFSKETLPWRKDDQMLPYLPRDVRNRYFILNSSILKSWQRNQLAKTAFGRQGWRSCVPLLSLRGCALAMALCLDVLMALAYGSYPWLHLSPRASNSSCSCSFSLGVGCCPTVPSPGFLTVAHPSCVVPS